MRWLFCNPNNPQEMDRRESVIGKIVAWWRAFAAKTDDLTRLFSGKSEWDLPAWMQEHLQSIDNRLMWEYGPSVQGDGHRLVITPECDHQLRPMVNTILERAPQIEGWEFYAYRLPENLEQAAATVKGRTGGNIEGVMAHARVDKERQIDLVYYSPRCSGPDDKQARSDAFILSETLLGEEILDKWMGAIEVAPLKPSGGLFGLLKKTPKMPENVFPLDRLRPMVDALIASMREQLPPSPLYEIAGYAESRSDGKEVPPNAEASRPSWLNGTVFEDKPPELDEYPGQRDIVIASSAWQDLWAACHSSAPFYSCRFSQHNETFCYVKVDRREWPMPQMFDERTQVDDALSHALVESKVGCPTGGAIGLHHWYLDLALVDLSQGIKTVRQVMRECGVPNRSWILFWDADLADEWVGIYDDTPPPPA